MDDRTGAKSLDTRVVAPAKDWPLAFITEQPKIIVKEHKHRRNVLELCGQSM